MGKCVSKHPSVLTIALSEKDLANTNQIWSKFSERADYITLNDDPESLHGNQLCVHESNYLVSMPVGVRNQQNQNRHQEGQQHQQQKQDGSKEQKYEKDAFEEGEGEADGAENGDEIKVQNKNVKESMIWCWRMAMSLPRNDENSTEKFQAKLSDTHGRVVRTTDKFERHNNNGRSRIIAIETDEMMNGIERDDHRHECDGDGDGFHNNHYQHSHQYDYDYGHEYGFDHDDIVVCRDDGVRSHNANISQNDGHLKLVHMKLPDGHIIKCYDGLCQKEMNNGENRKKFDHFACEKQSKDARNKQNKQHIDERILTDDLNSLKVRCNREGQTESKKALKKYSTNNSIETKGTAMSFGFHKKLTSTPKKLKKLIEGSVGDMKSKHDKCNNPKEPHERTTRDIFDTQANEDTSNLEHKDNNGNTEQIANKIQFEKMGAAGQKTTSNQGIAGQHANLPGANNRFGFRGIIRPASTGIATRSEKKDNANNNYFSAEENIEPRPSCLVSNLKRRSKSAHAGRSLTSDQSDELDADGNRSTDGLSAVPPKIAQPKTLTFNLSHNSTIEYQRQQFFQQPTTVASGRIGRTGAYPHQTHQVNHQNIFNTGMHTNVIVRPTPRAPPASFSKFTLHTTSLPKPEFPIAISLSTTTTPTTPGNVFSPSKTPMTAIPPTPISSTSTATSTATTTASEKGARAREAQHPLTVVAAAQTCSYANYMDPKAAKHVANSTTRRGFSGSREISADSGIAGMDMALESSSTSGRSVSPSKRSRSRPRNLQMVMNGRHKFEVKDLDDPLSSESSSIAVEPLALPKLPSESSQAVPLPLSGLVRSNTVLSRDSKEADQERQTKGEKVIVSMTRNLSDDSESREEKLCLDRSVSEKSTKLQFREINVCSSKTSSPGSSIMVSWCNAAGEALATRDSSIMNSITDYNNSSKTIDQIDEGHAFSAADLDYHLELKDDDLNTISSDMNISPMSATTFEPMNSVPSGTFTVNSNAEIPKAERPKSLGDSAASIEKKFAEMVLAGSEYLIDDETSPTDSLVSSTASDEIVDKKKKHKINEELQEKDIDEISPELEVGSPISPGTPTHASRSLSLSDCGNLIDDEIADQPALLFNTESQPDGLESIASRREKTDTPTLMETGSLRSLKSLSKARTALQQAIELNLRTPISLRKKVMERAESLDTLSPCESICSDDLMMDFEINSSVDSIDRSTSIKSRSGSDINKIDETELFSEFEKDGTDLMKELNTMIRSHKNNREREKNRVIAHLPARATRLLNRSRLQQQCNFNADSPDSAKSSSNSQRRITPTSSRASSNGGSAQQKVQQQSPLMQRSQRETLSSSDDLMLYDRSFRNAMIYDVLQFKRQLLRLRRILEETDTINPFDTENGQTNNHCGFDLTKDADLIKLISSSIDEPIEDITDLRRQVVYLQTQVDDRDRTIRLQRDLIEKLEAEKATLPRLQTDIAKECNNIATQTERTRPLSIGAESLTRSKPEYTSYTTHFPAVHQNDLTALAHQHQQHLEQQLKKQQAILNNGSSISSSNSSNSNNNNNNNNNSNNNNSISSTMTFNGSNKFLNQTRRHTIISTTLTNYNTQQLSQVQQAAAVSASAKAATTPRRASMTWENKAGENFPSSSSTTSSSSSLTSSNPVYKPVRITLIGDTLQQWNDEKMKFLHENHGKLENSNSNRSQHICNNGQQQNPTATTNTTTPTKSGDLAKIVKTNIPTAQTVSIDDNAQKSTTTTTTITTKCQQSNSGNSLNSNENYQNPTVTIV